jgi:hypothetical protein
MAKKENIKIYGTDLKKDWDDLKKKQKSLEGKIRKRAKLVLNEHGYSANVIDSMDVKYLLPLIIRAEEKYVAQSRQTELFEKKTMSPNQFNELKDREKWTAFRDENIILKGTWHCKHCGVLDVIGPHRASPFSGASVHCGDCDEELTRRTGGGQNDPFNWELRK